MKGRLNSKGRKTCRADGPPLRFVQRWERWTQPSASRALNHGSVTSCGFRDFEPEPTLRKPRRVGHPQMETEFSFPELYFLRKVGHPPLGFTRKRSVKCGIEARKMTQHDYGIQSARIVQTVKRLCPSCTVDFDGNRAPNSLRFRIENGSTTLTKAYPEYHVSEVTDWTDEKLQQMIEVLTGGLVRKST
jgi:hypothetical protein